jgi:hypothetical protein
MHLPTTAGSQPSDQPLMTSDEWRDDPEFMSVVILDYDGWDRRNFQFSFYEELITRDQMRARIAASTCMLEQKNGDYQVKPSDK